MTKKILMICSRYFPGVGGENYYKAVAEGVAAKGHYVEVWTPLFKSGLKRKEVLNNVTIIRYNPKKPFNRLFFIFRFFDFARFDIIHGFDYRTILNYLPFRFFYPRKPFYCTFLGYESVPPDPKVVKTRQYIEKIATGSILGGHYLKKWYGHKSPIVSYGGYTDRQWKDMPSEYSAVFVGRIDYDTGLLLYIDVLVALKVNHNYTLPLFVYGILNNKSIIEELELKKKQYGIVVEFKGFAPDPVECYQEHRFAFLSSCLANLDAMYQKRLVFSMYDNELKKDYLEMVPGALNFSVISGSGAEMADRIMEIVKNPEIEINKINKAFEYVTEQSWQSVVNKHLSLFGLGE